MISLSVKLELYAAASHVTGNSQLNLVVYLPFEKIIIQYDGIEIQALI